MEYSQNLPKNIKTNCGDKTVAQFHEEKINDGNKKSTKRGCALSNIPHSSSSVESKGQTVERCWSKYDTEFDEMAFIAGGGFGKVFRARHKLDCTEYAIKQIKTKSTKMTLCTLAEVKTIAKLNHPNIVQYKTAWLEPYVLNDTLLKMVKPDCNTATEQESSETPSDVLSSSSVSVSNITSNKSSDFIQFEKSGNETEASECSSETSQYYDNRSLDVFRPKPKLAILYIQMSLCQLTLRQWLDERNTCPNLVDYYIRFFSRESGYLCHVDIVNDIFSQLLSGLSYIHSKNIVHHDIKPSNIFVGKENDMKLIVQIGDFGLSCSLQDDGNNNLLENSFQRDHRGMGTTLYAAPEQLKGHCNPKSDAYSLGIVLLELLLKFDTGMERVRTIEKARKGSLPSELDKDSMKLLKRLLSDVKERPAPKDVLESVRQIVQSQINLEQDLRALKISQSGEELKDVTIRNLKKQIHTLTEKTKKQDRQVKKLRLSQTDEKLKNVTIRNLKKQIHTLTTQTKKQNRQIKDLRLSQTDEKFKDDTIRNLKKQVKELNLSLYRKGIAISKLNKRLSKFRLNNESKK